MTENKHNKTTTTLKEVLVKIEPNYKSKLQGHEVLYAWKGSKNIVNDLANLFNKNILHVYGFEAYIICQILKIPIIVFCEISFSNLKIESSNPKEKGSTKPLTEMDFIKQFIVTQKLVAKKSGMTADRLNKVIKGERNGFYAHEVIAITKTQNYDLTKAFDELYSNKFQKLITLATQLK